MPSHHEPFAALGPVDWSAVPADDLPSFLADTFASAQTIIDSIPVPAPVQAATAARRARAQTDPPQPSVDLNAAMAAQLRCRLPSAAISGDRHQLAGNLRHIAGSSSISLPYSSPAPAAFLSLHLTRSANPSLSQTISSPDLASLVAAVDAGGGGGLVPPGGSGKGGGGGGGGGDDGAGPDPEPSDPDGFFDILLGGWRSRVAADPQFPFKVLMEELVGVTSCVLGDMASRPNFGLNELDFVFSTLVVGSIVNFVLMYLLAPTAASSTAAASAFPSYMFEIGPYSPLARVGTFVYKGVMFAAVGFAAGLAGTAISNGLIALRKKMDPEFETPNAPPSTVLNAVTWAIHMGISSNFRYQALNGVEYVMERALPAAGFKASVVVLRCLNNVVGGMSFVVLARMTGSQKSEAKGEVNEKLIVAAGEGDSEEEFKGADDADESK